MLPLLLIRYTSLFLVIIAITVLRFHCETAVKIELLIVSQNSKQKKILSYEKILVLEFCTVFFIIHIG